MKNSKLYFLILFSLLYIGFPLYAQKFTASTSKSKVAVGEQFQITFSINTNCSGFRAPNMNDFDVYSGPNQSSNMSFVNGNMSQSISFSYIIAAKREGKFTIGAASTTVNGNRIESNSLSIEVTKGANQSQSQNQRQSASAPSQNADENIFARTSVMKSKVYQGEQVTVIHKVYTRLNLRGFQDIKFPSYDGFWSQEVPQQGQIDLSSENIDGVVYNVAELKRVYLFPQRSGTLEIDPLQIQCIVRQRSNRAPQTIFDQFFGTGGVEDVIYSLKTKSVKIDVSPLPEHNKPFLFSGAVGSYSFKAEMDKEKVKANDAINLKITISGRGNLKLIDPPKLNFPEDFEAYDPKIADNIVVNSNGVSGSKTFEYLIIPRHEGDYKVDQLSFNYFDPEKKSYVVIPAPEFNVHVEKGNNPNSSSATNMVSNVSKEDVKLLGNDIHYIKMDKDMLVKKEEHFFGSLLFYSGLLTPLLMFIGFIGMRKKHLHENSNIAAVKSRKATKMAKKRLLLAESYLKNNNKESFYDEVFNALYGYLSDKLTIPISDISKEVISNTLKMKQVKDITNQQLMSILENCEFARYAPSAVSGDLNAIYTQSVELITKLEEEIK